MCVCACYGLNFGLTKLPGLNHQDPHMVQSKSVLSLTSKPRPIKNQPAMSGLAPLQKNAQLSVEALKELLEMCCLWIWMVPLLKKLLGAGPGFDALQAAWEMGNRASITFFLRFTKFKGFKSVTCC